METPVVVIDIKYYRGVMDGGLCLQEQSARGRKPRRAVVIYVSLLVLGVPPASITDPMDVCRAWTVSYTR